MIKKILIISLIFISCSFSQSVKEIIGKSDIIWNSPSTKSIESMLVGNGSLGINIWAEKTGDIYIYLGSTDSWDEYSRLAKVGLVKIHIMPNPFENNFYQRMDLYNGQILIEAGKPDEKLKMKIWVDANNPVVNLEYESKSVYSYEVSPVIWRDKIRELKGDERHSAYGFINSGNDLSIYPDSILDTKNDNIICFHRNKHSIWNKISEQQGMSQWAESHEDPLMNNTYGYLVRGSGLTYVSKTLLRTNPEKDGRIRIFTLVKKSNQFVEWLSQINDISKTYEKKNHPQYYKNHISYWNKFWNKSYINLYGTKEAEKISQAYTLQRFISASAGRGKFPIKFNGSIFTVDSCDPDKKYDADYRMWGGPYWHQNIRLIYWPLLTSGDYDLIKPFFNMYLDDLPYAKERTKILFNHEGAFFPETFYFWGAYAGDNFGWKTDVKNFKHIENQYIRYHYQGSLETLAMMFEYFDHTGDIKFAKEQIVPFAEAVMQFYENHFPIDKNGKLELIPSQALESFWDIKNSTPEVAGLNWNLKKILNFSNKIISEDSKIKYKQLLQKIPSIPMGLKEGKKVILPYESKPVTASNSEMPELYSVFPYRFYGINKPELDIALNTYYTSQPRGARCWQHTDVISAYLGVVDSAKKLLVERLGYNHPQARIPSFWGNNMDWSPDQDHGGNLMITLQAMLIQYDNEKINLFPAFPKEWNVDFKLNAPNKTTVSASYKDGKLLKYDVSPKNRKKDLIIK